MGSERVGYYDVMKGIGIIFVIWVHCLLPGKAYYGFLIPFFFFISGVLYSSSKTFDVFIKNKIKRIIVPFIFFSFCSLAILIIKDYISNNLVWQQQLKNLITLLLGRPLVNNAPLWFLTCLFSVYVLYRLIDKSGKFKYVLIFVFSLLGFLISKQNGFIFNLFKPYMINAALSGIVFFAIGVSSKKFIDKNFVLKSKNNYLMFISFVICSLLWVVTSNMNLKFVPKYVDMSQDILGNYFLFYISSITGIFVFLYICKYINAFCEYANLQFFSFLGKSSLVIMSIHYPLLVFKQSMVAVINNVYFAEFAFAFILLLVCCPMCLMFKQLIPRLTGY